MKLTELIIVGAFAAMLVFALATCPFESIASFNPVEWLADTINGFLNLIKNLFFGWLK